MRTKSVGASPERVDQAPGRLSVIDYFERGLRRAAQPPLRVRGETQRDADGHSARFSLEVRAGVITAVRFQSSPCTALIAYCEVLAERMAELSLGEALSWSAREDLLAVLPGIPPYKRSLGRLAAAALRSAVEKATEGPSS